jgi:hypothetical protein
MFYYKTKFEKKNKKTGFQEKYNFENGKTKFEELIF